MTAHRRGRKGRRAEDRLPAFPAVLLSQRLLLRLMRYTAHTECLPDIPAELGGEGCTCGLDALLKQIRVHLRSSAAKPGGAL